MFKKRHGPRWVTAGGEGRLGQLASVELSHAEQEHEGDEAEQDDVQYACHVSLQW